MKVENIDPNSIKVPTVRITSDFDEEIKAMFEDDIKKSGINQPLLVAREGNELWVVDGFNRLQEAKLQGMKTVPCVVTKMSLKEIQLRNLVLNRLRGKTKVSEEVAVIKDLWENHKCGIEEIVERTGMRQERVEQLIKISEATEEVRQALDEEEIKLCAAYQIARLEDHDAQIRSLRIVQQYRNMTCRDIKGYVDEVIKIMNEQKGKNTSDHEEIPRTPMAKCTICKRTLPVEELTSVILCRNCFSVAVLSWEEAKKESEEEQGKEREERGNDT